MKKEEIARAKIFLNLDLPNVQRDAEIDEA